MGKKAEYKVTKFKYQRQSPKSSININQYFNIKYNIEKIYYRNQVRMRFLRTR